MTTMRAALVTSFGEPPRIATVEAPHARTDA